MSQIIATETLAKLYINHGVLDKAKEIYKILFKQKPERDDYQKIITDLDSKISNTEEHPKDYQETLDQGFAKDPNGMGLDEAIDEFDNVQKTEVSEKVDVDPVVLDQIMIMTDFESLQENLNQPEISVMPDALAESMPDSNDDADPLKQMVKRWVDLLLIKRKMNQLKRVKQRIS